MFPFLSRDKAMERRSVREALPHTLSLTLAWVLAATASAPALAQSAPEATGSAAPVTAPAASTAPAPADIQPPDWRGANDGVGAFRRGHIDIYRWEQEQQRRASALRDAQPTPAEPFTLAQAREQVLLNRPDLIGRVSLGALERSKLRLRTLEALLEVEQAWLQAVAAQQRVRSMALAIDAAESGAELARRMAVVGNYSAANRMTEELTLWDVRQQKLLAEQEAQQAAEKLWRLVASSSQRLSPADLAARLPAELTTADTALPLPASASAAEWESWALSRHPEWPLLKLHAEQAEQGLSADEKATMQATQAAAVRAALQAGAAGTAGTAQTATEPQWPLLLDPRQTRWPHRWEEALQARAEADALERRIRSDVRLALSAWQAAEQLHRQNRDEVQRLQTALQEDALLQYNGMLKSTWDLLARARSRVQSEAATQQSQRDAALAAAQFRAVLSGLPFAGASLGTPGAAGASAAPAH